MRKYLSKLALASLLFVTACEDSIDIKPFDLIDDSKAFETVADLRVGANGVYATISGQNIYAINTLIADEVRRADTNTGQGMQLFDHNIVAGDATLDALWLNAYQVIDRANRVLAATERITGETPAEVTAVNQIRGEMLGVRAYQHFDLYRTFANYDDPNAPAVPYMEESKISSPARLSKADFFSKLNKDINDAESLLNTALAAGASISNEVFNVRAVQGLRARVALYTKDYETAIKNATAVIESNEFNLTSANDFPGLWDDTVEGEVIFKLLNNVPADGTIDIWERATNPDVFFWAGSALTATYDAANDVRYSSYLEAAGSNTRVVKYNRIAGSKNVADIKMMRTAEMYLIRAEAYAMQASPNLTLSAADVTTLLNTRLITPGPALSFATQAEALNAIQLERRRELAFEGHRFFDLKRWGLPIKRNATDTNNGVYSAGLNANDYRFTLPIPQSEIFANPNMEQNPNYNN